VNARDNNSLSEIDEVAIYVLGRIEQFIEDFAKSSGTSAYELTERVAALLHSQIQPVTVDRVPEVPSVAPRRHRNMEPVEVDERPHRDSSPLDIRRKKHQHYDNFEGRHQDRFTVAKKLWKQGLTLAQIAKKMGVKLHTAGSYLSKSNLPVKRPPSTAEQRKAWREAKRNNRKYSPLTGAASKGGTYNGKHWMQDPANREKMMDQIKHMHEMKEEVAKARQSLQ
jgi:hypothetical protein